MSQTIVEDKLYHMTTLNVYMRFRINRQGSFWGAILRDSRIFFSKIALISLGCENSQRRGWSSGNTLAYHTGDPSSIPGRGGSSKKCESI